MELSYSFRKSAFDKTCQWTLTKQTLVRTDENGKLEIPYKEIPSVRLQFQEYFRYRHNNYCREITTVIGTFQILSTHYVDFAEFEDRAESYTPFVKALVKNLKTQNPLCIIHIGQKPSAFSGNIALVVASLLMLYFLSFVLPFDGKIEAIVGVILLAWGYIKMSSKVNLPRTLNSDEIPDDVLPQK